MTIISSLKSLSCCLVVLICRICSLWTEVGWGEACLTTGNVHCHFWIEMSQMQNFISKYFQYQRERIKCEHYVLTYHCGFDPGSNTRLEWAFYSSSLDTTKFCFHQIVLQEGRSWMWVCHCYVWRQSCNPTLILSQSQSLNHTPN